MKELRKSVKKQGYRLLASLMTCASLYGVASPALAAMPTDVSTTQAVEEVQQAENTENNGVADTGANTAANTDISAAVNTEENTDADANVNNDENANTDENVNTDENANAEQTTDAEQFSEEEIKAAQEDSAQAKKKAEADEAKKQADYEKQLNDYNKKCINEFGNTLGKEVADVIMGKYDSVSQAICSIGAQTMKGVNEAFVKNIPYGGGFAYTLIKAMTESSQPTDAQQTQSILNKINQTINSCTDALIQKSSINGQDQYISNINSAITALKEQYDHKNVDLTTATNNFENNTTEYNKVLANFYSSDYKDNVQNTNPYWSAFKAFIKNITGGQTALGSSANGGGKNVYQLTDSVAMDGKKHIMESYDQRVALVENLQNIFKDGNSALKLAMDTDKYNVKATIAYCQYNKGLIENEKAYTTDAEKLAELQKAYDEFDQMEVNYLKREARVEKDLSALEEMQSAFKTMTETQKSNIEADKTNFENNLPKETVVLDGGEFKAMTIKKTTKQNDGSEKTEQITVYPSINKETGCIEYKDKFGYVCAKQERSKKETVDITAQDVKVGEKYMLYENDCIVKNPLKGEITVTKIYEDESVVNMIGNFFRNIFSSDSNEEKYTSTKIDYIDKDGTTHTGLCISNESTNRLYRYKVRDDIQYESGYKAA